jgi:serine/threonine protein kinase
MTRKDAMLMADTPLRQDSVTQLVLQTLVDGPRHGWDIAQALESSQVVPNGWDAGAVYAILRRLEDRGFVASQWEAGPDGKRVRWYGLTRQGEKRLSLAPPDPDGQLASELTWVTDAISDRYSVVRLLGRGAVGSVYLALDRTLQRYVALKVLQRPLTTHAEVRERFLREARTNAALAHPAIVPVFALHADAEICCFAMQYVPGESLAAMLAEKGRLPAADVCRILAELAGALDYAHQQRVVHRDIKPENILMHRDTGMPMLTDFGVARAISLDAMLPGEQRAERDLLYGTPHFMSPEQIDGGEELDGRSDLYALGALGYTMLAGRTPFDGRGMIEIAAKRLTSNPRPLEELAVGAPSDLIEAISRCLSRHPGDRWRDGRTLREALLAQGTLRKSRWWR